MEELKAGKGRRAEKQEKVVRSWGVSIHTYIYIYIDVYILQAIAVSGRKCSGHHCDAVAVSRLRSPRRWFNMWTIAKRALPKLIREECSIRLYTEYYCIFEN